MSTLSQAFRGRTATGDPRRSGVLERPLAWAVRHLYVLALGVLLVGVASPQAPPTGLSYVAPGTYHSVWSIRFGGASLFEIAFFFVFVLWLIERLSHASAPSRFDGLVWALGIAAVGFEAISLPGHWQDARFLAFDVEHLLVPLAGYFLVTRFVRGPTRWRHLLVAIVALLCLRSAELVLRYGLSGSTEFGTSTGRIALLITEDGLLLIIPALFAYGALLERRLRGVRAAAAVAFIGSVVVVDLFSLRRGALLFILGALLVRTVIAVRPRTVVRVVAGVIAVTGFLVLLNAEGPLAKDVSYAVRSTFLQTKDSSSSQRQNELRNFVANMDGIDWPFGRGLGVVWRGVHAGPVDAAAFGSKETPYLRIGWHVYALDWAYKFGLVGIVLLALLATIVARRARRLWHAVPPAERNAVAALGISFPVFLLLLFTNLRIGLFAGITLGLLSTGSDFWRSAPEPATEDPSILPESHGAVDQLRGERSAIPRHSGPEEQVDDGARDSPWPYERAFLTRVRDRSTWRRAAAVGGFFLVLVLALFPSALLGGKVLSAGDALYSQPPFVLDRPADFVRPSNPVPTDPVQVFYPDLLRTRQALEKGALPLWNAAVGAGRPLLASQQHAPLFPSQWLALLLPFLKAMGYIVALKILAAAVGVFMLCRSFGLHAGPALLGGTTFAFGTYLITWSQHPHTNAWLLLPWLFLASRRMCRLGTPLDAIGLGVLIGLLLLAGHPESELNVLLALTAYTLFELRCARVEDGVTWRIAIRRSGFALLALVFGLLLSAAQTLPFLELLNNSYPNPRGGPPPSAKIFLSWFFPELWGQPDKLFQGVGPGNYQERTAYVGVLPVLLAVSGLVIRRRRAQLFFLALSAVALCIVLPTPLNGLVRSLPGANFIPLSRMLVLVSFGGAILAAFGLQHLLDASSRERVRIVRVMALVAALPLVWLLGRTQLLSHWQEAVGQLPSVTRTEASGPVVALAAVWRWALIGTLSVGALAFCARLGHRRQPAVVIAVALFVTAVDLITLNAGYQPAVAESIADPPAPPPLRQARAMAGSSRIAGDDLTFLPNLAARYGVRDARAHDFPISDRYGSLFAALGENPLGATVRSSNPREKQLLDLFSVRYKLLQVTARRKTGVTRQLVRNRGALPRSWIAYSWRSAPSQAAALALTAASTVRESRNRPVIEGGGAPPARTLASRGATRIITDTDDEVKIEATAQTRGYLVLDDSYYPGWKATVDGHPSPIRPANENFRAVPISAGRHVIAFRYRPASFTIGAYVSIGTVLVMLGVCGLLWLRASRRTRVRRASRD